MKKISLAIFMLLLFSKSFSQNNILTQTIKGQIIDVDSKSTMVGVSVTVANTSLGAVTDTAGNFKITNVPVGRFDLVASFLGYEPTVLSQVLISSGKELFLNIEMKESHHQLKEVKISANADKTKAQNEMATVSARGFSVEETKRYAAAILDPARMAQNFAGVSNAGDFSNELVVRGNTPKGVQYRLEGVEVTNTNHFANMGSSGGPISMLSSSTLANSDFYSGAFPAEIGNATSGVLDLKLRTGNADKREHSFMIGALGVEAASEGYFTKKSRASYLVNYRYSTVTLLKPFLKGMIDNVAPAYQDVSYKFNFPTKQYGTLSWWGVAGQGVAQQKAINDTTKWKALNDSIEYKSTTSKFISGISHKISLSNKTFMSNIFSVSIDDDAEKDAMVLGYKNYERKNIGTTQNTNYYYHYSFMLNHKFDVTLSNRSGFIINNQRYKMFVTNYDFENDKLSTLLSSKGNSFLYQAFTQFKFQPIEKLVFNAGVHAVYFELGKELSIEPRTAIQYFQSKKQTFGLSAGWHSRTEHIAVYEYRNTASDGSFTQPNKKLGLAKAFHLVGSYDRKINRQLHLKTELYYQYNYRLGVENDLTSTKSLINSTDLYELINSKPFVPKGTGTNYGLDVTFERSLYKHFYYLAAASVFKSTYKTLAEKEFPTAFDKGYTFNLVTGKEFEVGHNHQSLLGVNVKFLTTGGNKYTPIDLQKSIANGNAVYQTDKSFSKQTTPYFRFDAGLSYKINKKNITHTIMFDVQNVTNHQNIYSQYYDNEAKQLKYYYQMGLFPYFNYRIEF